MRFSTLAILAAVGTISSVQPAWSASCYDLWWQRNEIYNRNGFCFKTQDGMDAFDNSDCYTDDPDFTRREQRQIQQIKREENNMGC